LVRGTTREGEIDKATLPRRGRGVRGRERSALEHGSTEVEISPGLKVAGDAPVPSEDRIVGEKGRSKSSPRTLENWFWERGGKEPKRASAKNQSAGPRRNLAKCMVKKERASSGNIAPNRWNERRKQEEIQEKGIAKAMNRNAKYDRYLSGGPAGGEDNRSNSWSE